MELSSNVSGLLRIYELYGPDEKVIVDGYDVPVVGLRLSADSFWDSFGDNFWGQFFGTIFGTIFMDLMKKLLLLDILSLSLKPISQLTDDLIGSGWTFLSLINFQRKHPGQQNRITQTTFSGDHNSKFFFHCLSSHFDYMYHQSFPGKLVFDISHFKYFEQIWINFQQNIRSLSYLNDLYVCIVEYFIYDLFVYFF